MATTELVKFVNAEAKAPRIAADFIQRHEPVETIKGGILHPLGHRWPGQLLEAGDKIALQTALLPQQEEIGEKLKSIR